MAGADVILSIGLIALGAVVVVLSVARRPRPG